MYWHFMRVEAAARIRLEFSINKHMKNGLVKEKTGIVIAPPYTPR